MALNVEFLEEQKKLLLAEKVRLESGLGRFAKPTDLKGDFETQMEDLGKGDDESALEVEDYVDNLGIENTLEEELKDTIDALAKIDAGTYGLCEVSGKEIAIDRLKAYPAARTAL